LTRGWEKRANPLDNPVPSEFDGVGLLGTPGGSIKRGIPDSMIPEKEE